MVVMGVLSNPGLESGSIRQAVQGGVGQVQTDPGHPGICRKITSGK